MTQSSVDDVVSLIQGTITAPDERDKQTRIGPSSLGKSCEYCLGRMMVHGDPPRFNHYAWLGTCVHLWLEQNVQAPEGVQLLKESKAPIGDIPGYGPIVGNIDLVYVGDTVVITDYKTTSLKKAKSLMNGYITRGGAIDIISPQLLEYYVQINAYGLGVKNLGYNVETVMLYFIPRDAASIRDHKWLAFDFNEAVVDAALQRAGEVYAWAVEHGIDGLESDPACWECMRDGRVGHGG